MQITINTSDILGNEMTIRDEVIDQVSSALLTDLRTKAKEKLGEMLDNCLRESISAVTKEAISIHIDTEFTDFDQYGRPGKTASVRDRIADYVQQQCTFKKSQYPSDRNHFTNAVQETVEQEMRKFKSEFTSLITRQVVEQSMEMAVATLKASLGIKTK